MDGLALAAVNSVNAHKLLLSWENPILLVRNSLAKSSRSLLDTPQHHTLTQDTSASSDDSFDYYLDPDAVIIPLCKSTRNHEKEITIGRKTSNDICLADTTLSKIHGWFIRPAGKAAAWQYVDNSSTNGTIINRHKIIPNRPTLLRFGDELVMGDVQMMFLSKENVSDLMDYLRAEDGKTRRIIR